ncbi:TraB/GumN family protein [Thalassococcus sp. BH17M4-6]|uniref:TraB/GumN family protein n=1 Tax=Thalassococcus sp. BH17M4-6 TaxID=3413148 RepID=UPI003BE2472A
MRLLPLVLFTLSIATSAAASCGGTDLRTTLSTAERQELDAAVADTPFPNGNHWRATRGDAIIHLIGTVHLDDPRLDGPEAQVRPVIEGAGKLLLEMTPADEKALQRDLTSNPDMLLLTDTTLPELMDDAAWEALAEAVAARGIPPFMAAKFQPWYLSMLLGIPPCAAATLTEGRGLDKRLSDIAEAADVPMAPLEDYRTVFAVFASAPLEEQVRMMESAIIDTQMSEDMFATIISSYMDESTAEGWEVMRLLSYRASPLPEAEIDAAFDSMEELLLIQRNRDWIPVILDAAGPEPIVVAAGAAHFPGKNGVLALLEAEGFAIKRQPF